MFGNDLKKTATGKYLQFILKVFESKRIARKRFLGGNKKNQQASSTRMGISKSEKNEFENKTINDFNSPFCVSELRFPILD